MLAGRLLVVGFLALLSACGGGNAAGPAPHAGDSGALAAGSDIFGLVNGQPVRRDDLDAETLRRMLDTQNEAQQRVLHSTWMAFEETVARRLIEAEAKTRGTTVEAMLAAEIDDKLAPLSDDEVRRVFDENQDAIGMPFDVAGPLIREQLTVQRRDQAQRAFAERLRKNATVEYRLPVPVLPRFAVEVGDAPAWGRADAPVTIVEFADYQCPYCGQARHLLSELKQRYPNELRVVFRDFPLSQHTRARPAAAAAFCAGEQGQFWPFHDRLFENMAALDASDFERYGSELKLDAAAFAACVASDRPEKAIRAHEEAGRRIGVEGTPAIFVNGMKLVGLLPLPVLQALIDRELGRGR